MLAYCLHKSNTLIAEERGSLGKKLTECRPFLWEDATRNEVQWLNSISCHSHWHQSVYCTLVPYLPPPSVSTLMEFSFMMATWICMYVLAVTPPPLVLVLMCSCLWRQPLPPPSLALHYVRARMGRRRDRMKVRGGEVMVNHYPQPTHPPLSLVGVPSLLCLVSL